MRCTAYSNSCLKALPNWLHWLCGAFSSACDATETFCLGWEDICTSSLEVCTLWGSACSEVIPAWAIPCFWENQPDHTVAQQLTDGKDHISFPVLLSLSLLTLFMIPLRHSILGSWDVSDQQQYTGRHVPWIWLDASHWCHPGFSS